MRYFCSVKTTTLKKFSIYILSFILLLPTFGSSFTYLNFKLQQEEIAKTICVQRKMVFNSCNGRCELQKSLKRYTDNEKSMQNTLKEKVDVVYVQELLTTSYELVQPIVITTKTETVVNHKPISFSAYTFRPPAYFIS
jgi:thioredoxin-related protein